MLGISYGTTNLIDGLSDEILVENCKEEMMSPKEELSDMLAETGNVLPMQHLKKAMIAQCCAEKLQSRLDQAIENGINIEQNPNAKTPREMLIFSAQIKALIEHKNGNL